MPSKLLIWLGCLLFIVHLSRVTADLIIHDDDDDDNVDVQSSDDIADYDNNDYDTVLLSRRQARWQQWLPSVVADAPPRGTIDRALLTPRRDRSHSRRRKKLDDGSRRSRVGGGRGSRRRGGSGSVSETSSPVSTTNITSVEQSTSTTLTSARSLVNYTVDLTTQSSQVTVVTEDSLQDRDVLVETISDDDDDMMMILMSNNGTTINQRGV